jgi:glycosyltransferase involved in cell wall biosynthesis
MAGDGPLRRDALDLLTKASALDAAWLPGNRDDIPGVMRSFDLFALPSLAEGISNTLLEAMASGLPVVATRVGGNPELVKDGATAKLVPPADPVALAGAIHEYVLNPELARRHGSAARRMAEQRFGLEVMVKNYMDLYDRALASRRRSHSFEHRG